MSKAKTKVQGERGSAGQHQGAAMKKGWPVKKLGDVTESISTGPFGTMLHKSDYVVDGIPLVNPVNIVDGRIVPSEKMMISNATRKRLSNYVLRTGDVVVGRRGELGRCAIVSDVEDGWLCGTGSCFIRLSKQVDERFFALLFRSSQIRSLLEEASVGTTMSNLNHGILNNLPVPVPPLAEQQRIVGLLDKAFEGLATAKANAEKNLQNARALFESHLQFIFADQWQTGDLVALADLATDITDGDHLPPPKSPTGVPFITIGNIVKETREIDFSDTFKVPRAYFDALKPYKKPRQGDVLYTVTGSFGIPVIVRDDAEFCFQRHIGLIRPKPDTSSSWLYYLFLSPQLFKQAKDGATGTAQKTVSLKLLRSFEVPKVSPKQQKQVVDKLDALSKETQRLARIYDRKLAALEALKKSLLHQAFTGEL